MTLSKIKSRNVFTESDVLVKYLQMGRFKNYNLINIEKDPPAGWKAARVYYHIDKSHDFWTNQDGEYNKTRAQFVFGKDLSKGSIRGSIQQYEGNTPLNEGLVLPYVNFETPLYFSEKEANDFNLAAVRPPYASVNQHYNFFHAEHEMSTLNHPETIAPNMYVVLDAADKAAENKLNELTDSMLNNVTVNGGIDANSLLSVLQQAKVGMSANEDIYYDPMEQTSTGPIDFLKEHEQAIQNIAVSNQEAYLKLANSGINIIFSYDDPKAIDDFNKRKNMFPMDISVKFSRSESTKFANAFKDTNIEETFVKDLIAGFATSTIQLEIKETITTVSQDDQQGSYDTISDTSESKNIPIVDVTNMINSIFQSETEESEIDKSLFILGDKDPVSLSGANKLYKELLKLAFMSKYNSMVQDHAPSFHDILQNKKTYSETLVYKVSKFNTNDAGAATGNPIQNYYFFNNDEDDVIEFVDTQVKYDKRYNYKIYSYDMSVGLQYYYDSFDDGPLGIDKQLEFLDGASAAFPQQIFLDVVYKPKVSLAETLVYEASTRVISRPPMPPEVTMVPFREHPDRMLIMMNYTTGKAKMQPIEIEDADAGKIQSLREGQELSAAEAIQYATDDIPFSYEIFRISSHPESYQDFKNNNIETVISKQAGSFLQTGLKKNKKYYYTVRTTDIHDMVSNPSPIYELEMVENSGVTYPVIRTVELKTEENKTSVKSMRKYIYIKPTAAQSFVNEEKSGLVGTETAINKAIVLGEENESVWNKRFKFRFTSRDTGKKIDVNVKFVQKNIQT
tara:strand:+ start:301 stop:2673 length:2373 start_codon:yes stop_codon:yes gene_type:complete